MDDVIQIIEKAAGAHTDQGMVRRVIVSPMADWLGHDALGVTIVLADDKLTGAGAIDLLMGINNALMQAGDERFAYLDYATEEELAAENDLEA